MKKFWTILDNSKGSENKFEGPKKLQRPLENKFRGSEKIPKGLKKI